MASRPRRSAAKKASEALVDWADSERTSNMSTRARRSEGRTSGVSRGPPSSPGSEHLNLTVKVPSNKLREATSRGRNSTGNSISVGGSEIVAGRRNRGPKKSYVVESDSDEEEEEEDEEMDDPNDEDADGDDDDMDVDAEGEEDAEGDVDMDTPAASTIKIQLPKAGKVTPRRPTAARVVQDDDDDDEDELSEIEVSDPDNTMDMSIDVGGAGDDDDDEEEDEEDAEGEEEDAEGEEEDAEGEEEEIEVADETRGPDAEGEDDSDLGSREGTPDLSKMTRRQRARFEDEPQQYMKLSDEVQAKKVFTAEELSMRRAEMARRRRNLSEKRNEEVKMETINKLLKKQAPKTKGKGGAAGDDSPSNEPQKPDVAFVRWVNSKKGSFVSVPEEMLSGPAGKVFVPGGLKSGKMVEEVV
ncbi:hypothetical protein CkaCkLH20_04028 [Colletotrichum karsti]|uniref:INO80 complex subunit B-like conserved region domain-containing protein n=1 Tax=Colletotrichum karsti TaxID=1095194 RepID=A0A9P6LMU3_9PEZI|nr:uncharacterized protein CkaCkLH20_04028 [Colletotrichum karsti]KAF9878536.1 hypothetical protein CkaCkLH20_04028 [Colletotrichum karsti]